MTWTVLALLSALVAVLVGWALPAWAASRIVGPAGADAEAPSDAPERRGRPTLGLAWLVWAIGVATASSIVALLMLKADTLGLVFGWQEAEWRAALNYSPFASAVVVVPLLLVAGAFALGLVDDTFAGSGPSGWFAGLRRGRLDGRGIKTLGIAALAFVTAGPIANGIGRIDSTVADAAGWSQGAYLILAWIAAALVVGLAARLVDRSDIEPGRALRTYAVLAFVGAGVSCWGLWTVFEKTLMQSAINAGVAGADAATAGLPIGGEALIWLAGTVACVLALVFGPMLAVWRHDLARRARLGSAGSLAMGALAGYLLARSAPLWLLGVFTLVLIALNLMTRSATSLTGEYVQSAASAGESVDAEHAVDDGTRAGGPTAEDDDARRDDVS